MVTAASGRETADPTANEPERDVKTARSPAPSEAPVDNNNNVYGNSAFEADNNNSKVSLVKDLAAEGAADAQSPAATTAVKATPSEILKGSVVNLPDSTAKNVTPVSGSNRE